jgi:hypothetical protein
MVKKYYLFIFIIVLVGCKKNYVFTYDNSGIVYQNFSDTIIDTSIFGFNNIKVIYNKTFDLANIDREDCQKQLSGKAKDMLYLLQENVYAGFYAKKNQEPNPKIIYIDKNVFLSPLGRINLCKGVCSYVFLKASIYNTLTNKELILYNIKSNKLCSVVFLAYRSPTREGMVSKKAIFLGNGVVEQISQPCLYFISEEVINFLNLNNVLNKKNYESYSFSGFEINEEGFVKLIN